MEDRILPVGSVVTLKKGNGTPVMVINRAALYKEDNKTGYFDYSSVMYPEGLEDPDYLVFFNHEDIEDLLFLGYRNEEELDFEDHYQENVEASGYKKLSVDDDE